MQTLHDFTVETIDGESRPLSDFAGKTLLVVNVASKCGLTPQYEGLEALYRKYADRGLVVVGFPCNQFAGQEPGSADEIKSFCSTKYDVTFPLMAKLDVNGESAAPVYQFLTSQQVGPEEAGDIKWNFGKFLVDGEGKVVARFAPTVT
ncbi:MAG: glutathione peroxidase, partial [Myxococcales bacterium]